mmetsp:Transcript_150433/g.419144  ORF Transcript_150433/g.419144 Transcript_150433/m.419144 type:complete len:141 (+) Transcript_150433:3-425(+)
MDTAGIVDLVLGAIAMDFVLTFDELIYESFGNHATKYMMQSLEPFVVSLWEGDAPKDKGTMGTVRIALLAMPRRFLLTILLMAGFTCRYYVANCRAGDDGTWVSQDMFTPRSTHFNIMNFITQQVCDRNTPFWTMPKEIK